MKKISNIQGVLRPFGKISLTLFFLIMALHTLEASSNFQVKKLTIDLDSAPMESVFNEIEHKTGYSFLFNNKDINLKRKVSVKFTDEEIHSALDELLSDESVDYEFLDNHIILKSIPETKAVRVVEVAEPQSEVSGLVTDADGLPLPGVSIVVKGTTRGTSTDMDGNYAIRATAGEVLVFSYLGFNSVEITLGASSKVDVKMQEGTSALDEVVVTAQGIKRQKKALGYAVSSVDAAVIESKPEADVSRILTGKVSGVEINAGGGFLGSYANIIIRSKNSISGSNQPLFIIDGAPISGGRSFDIDPNNIASIDVLKGLAASTLYGQDGRNGIIVIQTKTGQAGALLNRKFEITASTTTSFLEVANLPEFQNKYGQGGDNTINTTFFGNWGAAFNNQVVPHHLSIASYNASFPQYKDATTIYQPYKNNVSDFFDIGRGQTTSVLINKNFDSGNAQKCR